MHRKPPVVPRSPILYECAKLGERHALRPICDTPTGFSTAVLHTNTVPNALLSGLGRLVRPSLRRAGDLHQPLLKKPPLGLVGD